MIKRAFTRLLFWALKNKQFSSHEVACLAIAALDDQEMTLDDKGLCTAKLLEGLNALPISTIISLNEQGVLLLNGKPVDYDKARQLRDGAVTMLNSATRKTVREQIRYASVEMIVHKGLTPEQSMFGKAALWVIEQEESFYKLLIGEEQS